MVCVCVCGVGKGTAASLELGEGQQILQGPPSLIRQNLIGFFLNALRTKPTTVIQTNKQAPPPPAAGFPRNVARSGSTIAGCVSCAQEEEANRRRRGSPDAELNRGREQAFIHCSPPPFGDVERALVPADAGHPCSPSASRFRGQVAYPGPTGSSSTGRRHYGGEALSFEGKGVSRPVKLQGAIYPGATAELTFIRPDLS